MDKIDKGITMTSSSMHSTPVFLVQNYLERSAQSYPTDTAITCRGESISYQQLDSETNSYAKAFLRSGIGPRSFIPIFMSKGINSLIAMFSALKADCAYVPLDVSSPEARIKEIIVATGASHVLVDDNSFDDFKRIGCDLPVEVLNLSELDASDTGAVEYKNISTDIAYALFTSGSTGTPKGVMISHGMIIDYIAWCVDTFSIQKEDRVANHAPLYFDNSTFDIYTAMSSGAELHLVHDELNQIITALIPWLQKNRISVFFCVPSVLSLLLRSRRIKSGTFPDLRHIIAAGEVLPPDVVREFMLAVPKAQFTNMYGPTEITVDCTYHVIADIPGPETEAIPIGKARRNMQVFVRDEDGILRTEPGAVGEIAVRGASVSYGYLNSPEKTERAFIQNPSHELFSDPIYLTGDVGKINEEGDFLYIGRKDHQIKYMGNRIELGEIESALRRLPTVEEVAVVFRDAPTLEDKAICAAVVLARGAEMTLVQKEMQGKLPGYMYPRRWHDLSELPKTPNGKVDRQALMHLFE